MDLVWGVVALTVATLTVLLAVRRFVMVGSQLVFSRYVAVGGLVAFGAHHDDCADVYCVRFEVGGPGVFHNVTMHLFGTADTDAQPGRPAVRHTMAAGDDPIEWTFQLPAEAATRAWVMVTWVRPYLQGVESEALAQWLHTGRLYEWRWYSETTRYVRTVVRFIARRWSLPAGESMRDLPLYGRWRRTSSNTSADLLGPAASPPPMV
ncbi:hypothetical protein A5784_35785 [Mycobacterium sp. 852013-50091_SCH5140682]|uniref:hypothetical protein n=1 Tax=Mycobacterium sp. 852013-50091_SCH5140682 TaxID=1834109 RepID=UPI0007EA38C9|nr:hypothetical protein [Mycobacterium sp. 852013-50091_SCH5140682]OBC10875.1 hypothetical protein A5784_35785 [Mycobacterium sp. 852013-50091_SCH5140682]